MITERKPPLALQGVGRSLKPKACVSYSTLRAKIGKAKLINNPTRAPSKRIFIVSSRGFWIVSRISLVAANTRVTEGKGNASR